MNLNSPVVNIIGLVLDALGGLYLAYDLLGGKNGPLRLLTRVVTYCVCYFLAYSYLLGIGFGLVAGVGLGMALAIELAQTGTGEPRSETKRQAYYIAIRSIAIAFAFWLKTKSSVAPVFAITCWLALMVSVLFKFTPSDIDAKERPGMTKKKLLAAGMRGIMVVAAAVLAGLIGRAAPLDILYLCWIGVAVGIASGAVGIFTPLIEQWADELPPQNMGVLGTVLFLLGFVVQALPSIGAILSSH